MRNPKHPPPKAPKRPHRTTTNSPKKNPQPEFPLIQKDEPRIRAVSDKILHGRQDTISRPPLPHRIQMTGIETAVLYQSCAPALHSLARVIVAELSRYISRIVVHVSSAIRPRNVMKKYHAAPPQQAFGFNHLQLMIHRKPIVITVDKYEIKRIS
jgi:hypothetical protein